MQFFSQYLRRIFFPSIHQNFELPTLRHSGFVLPCRWVVALLPNLNPFETMKQNSYLISMHTGNPDAPFPVAAGIAKRLNPKQMLEALQHLLEKWDFPLETTKLCENQFTAVIDKYPDAAPRDFFTDLGNLVQDF